LGEGFVRTLGSLLAGFPLAVFDIDGVAFGFIAAGGVVGADDAGESACGGDEEGF
jgi:hypothetical protein